MTASTITRGQKSTICTAGGHAGTPMTGPCPGYELGSELIDPPTCTWNRVPCTCTCHGEGS